MSVAAPAYSHPSPALQSTTAEEPIVSGPFSQPVLLHLDHSLSEARVQISLSGSCLRGFRNAMLIELAALAVVACSWYLFRAF
ncbi:MAG: hypothetical protein KGN79_10305 [Acidobacteriota bacterium]|nr:hypothetical protein [Acidobacteriota bacterium]